MNRGEWTKKSNMNSLLLQWNATAKLADKFIRRGYSQFAPYTVSLVQYPLLCFLTWRSFFFSSPSPLGTFIFYLHLTWPFAVATPLCSLIGKHYSKYLGRFLFYPTNYEHHHELRTTHFPTINNSNKNNIS